MRIGLIVAIADEIETLLSNMGSPKREETLCGIPVREYAVGEHELYVANSGAGEIYAAGAAQLLISHYGAEILLNFGVCGGLTNDMSGCKVALVKSVVHYDFDISELDPVETARYPEYDSAYIPADERLLKLALEAEPNLRAVICASADKFVASAERKAELHSAYGAEICEMEAAGILLTANRCGVPVLLIKAVSDSVSGGAEEFLELKMQAADICVSTLLKILQKIEL